MMNGKLIAFVLACITFIGGLATGNILNYYNEKKSLSSSSVESTENLTEDLTASTEENGTVKLLNTMLNTDYRTVKVNNDTYNIVGYIEVNESNNDIIHSGINIDSTINNVKALVILDTPVTYVDEYNQQHILESYRWLAYVTDDYNMASFNTFAAVSEDGNVLQDDDIYYTYDNGIAIARVSYRSLIKQNIIEGNTHWSVE